MGGDGVWLLGGKLWTLELVLVIIRKEWGLSLGIG